MKITRETYLAQFPPEKRNSPARQWGNRQADAICSLHPTQDVIMLGARIIAGFRAECETLAYGSVSVVHVTPGDIGESEAAIQRHREFHGGADHLDVDAALRINFIQ